MFGVLFTALLAASSVVAHSNMFSPTPRENRDYAFESADQNSCESGSTDIPSENTFQRGQKVPVKWWWNNHDGGFIKMALIKDMKDFYGKDDQELFLRNENIIQGQCYTGSCNRDGFDPGNTHECNGQEMEIPSWVSDGVYTLQWSQIGGYNSEAVPTRQLPIYHTCANIRISGGVKLTPRPDDWVAPFFGGDMVQINGQSSGPDQCAFKNFDKEPVDPSVVNTKDDSSDTIRFGKPDGWAAEGSTNNKRADKVYLPRLGHVARRHSCKRTTEEEDSDVPKLH